MASKEIIDLLEEFQKREGIQDVTKSMTFNVVAASLTAASEGQQVVHLYRHVCTGLPLEAQKRVQRRLKEALIKTVHLYGTPKALKALFPLFKDLREEEIDHYGPRTTSIDSNLQTALLHPPDRHALGEKFFAQLWASHEAAAANQTFNHRFCPDLHFVVAMNLTWLVCEDAVFDFAETCMLNAATMLCSNSAEPAMWHVRGVVRQGGTREQARWTQELALRVAALCGVQVKGLVGFEEIPFDDVSDHTK